MDTYNVTDIICHAAKNNIDISPTDRQDWAMFCCALKVLGYGFSTFAALSNCSEQECEKAWRAERQPARYVATPDKAKAKIIALAVAAGMDLAPFRIDPADYPRYTPEDVFGDMMEATAQDPEDPMQPPAIIDPENVSAMEAEAEHSALYVFLCRLFHPDEVRRIFMRYRVGATTEFNTGAPALASAFPYLNAEGDCVDVHLMPYDAAGHRRKTGYCQNWLLSKLGQSDRRAPWPLFGEHLLALDPSAPVGLVESEKTALIAALAAPGYVWVATGSLNNLNARRCAAIRDREIYIFPDADGVDQWQQRAEGLSQEGFTIYFCGEFIRTFRHGLKDDLGDLICAHLNGPDEAQTPPKSTQ